MTTKQQVFDTLRHLKNGHKPQDMAAITSEWRSALGRLFDRLQSWLHDAVDQNLLTVRGGQRAFQEERLGEYTAPVLVISTPGGIDVQIAPRARFAAGTIGRVDLECLPKKYVMVRKEVDEWEIVELDPHQGWRFRPLTEESFWDVLGKLIA
jgi:hypothetical protein